MKLTAAPECRVAASGCSGVLADVAGPMAAVASSTGGRMSAGLGKELTHRERAVLRALERSLRAEDPRLAALLTNGPVAAGRAAQHPAGAPYWFWWRRRATD